MARSRARTPRLSPQSPPPITGVGPEPTGDFTGRYLVLLRDDGIKEGLQAVQGATGLSEVCNAADFTSAAVEMAQANEADVFVLDKLKVAVVDADPTQVSGLRSAASEDGAILAVEPERIMYALAGPTDPFATQFPFEYLRGYKDAVNHLYASMVDDDHKDNTDLSAVPGVSAVEENRTDYRTQQ
jgi:hypothetical protein